MSGYKRAKSENKTKSDQILSRAMQVDTPKVLQRRFNIAPMMEWTDRHCRFFHRLLTRRALIYTEMLTTMAVLRGDRARLLGFDPFEHPVALQLGGSDPSALAAAARIGEDFGYDEINLNVGCPSDRVQEGRFGACLMAEPALVADCVAAMQAAVKIPVTVKCRLGVDDQDPESGAVFIRRNGEGGGRRRADRACAQGLAERPVAARKPRGAAARLCHRAPAQMRASRISKLCSMAASPAWSRRKNSSAHVDGVMMGRAAYQEPWRLLASIRCCLARTAPFASPKEAALALIPYIERELAKGVRLLRHHPPRARPVPQRSRRARLPPASGDRSGQARGRRFRHG